MIKMPKSAANAAQTAPAELAGQREPFAGDETFEVFKMRVNGELPEGFPVDEAMEDPKFAELIRDYGARAAVRIYAAEQKTNEQVRAELAQQMRRRSGLPAQRRADTPLSGEPADCWQMTDEEFRAYDRALRRQRRQERRGETSM